MLHFNCVSDTVVLIAGGNGIGSMEIFTPNGTCSLDLGMVPRNNLVPILGFINGFLTFCSRFSYTFSAPGCASYNPKAGTWNVFTLMNHSHYHSPGIILKL